jgi:hypothetical protein
MRRCTVTVEDRGLRFHFRGDTDDEAFARAFRAAGSGPVVGAHWPDDRDSIGLAYRTAFRYGGCIDIQPCALEERWPGEEACARWIDGGIVYAPRVTASRLFVILERAPA